MSCRKVEDFFFFFEGAEGGGGKRGDRLRREEKVEGKKKNHLGRAKERGKNPFSRFSLLSPLSLSSLLSLPHLVRRQVHRKHHQLHRGQGLQRLQQPVDHDVPDPGLERREAVRREAADERVEHDKRPRRERVGDVVGQRVVQPGGDVGGVERAVRDVERHVAEGQQLEGHHREEEHREALEHRRRRAALERDEDEPGEGADPAREHQPRGDVCRVAQLREHAAV